MYSYTMEQWLFFFYFYCLFGWCFESSYVSLKNRHPVNRGFMQGPFLPLYGSGAIMMLVVSIPFQDNIFLTYLAGCIGATVLEYVTGVTMEALFKVRYWDYSNQIFNFRGQICLSSTLAWGGLTILMTHVIHKPIERTVLAIPESILTAVVYVVTICVVVDFTLSFKAAIDLRDILVKLEDVREEYERIQKRLDVIIAVSNEELEARRQQLQEKRRQYSSRLDELTDGIEERLSEIKQRVQEDVTTYPEHVREEIMELRTKYRLIVEKRLQLVHLRDFYKRHLIKGNPSMVSKRFKEALQELKESVDEHLGK